MNSTRGTRPTTRCKESCLANDKPGASGSAKQPCRPKLEIGDIFRRYGRAYRLVYGSTLTVAQDRVLRELAACRTGALGGHINECRDCGHETQAYNSCGHRLCPKCRGKDRRAWYEARTKEMLPVAYLHPVFTLPETLALATRQNPRLLYDLLFYASSQAVLETGRKWLRVELALILALHSFGQLGNHHPHTHGLLPAGGLSLEDGSWVSLPEGGTLPKKMLRELFQKKYLRRLAHYYRQGKLVFRDELAHLNDAAEFEKWLEDLGRRRWVIHIRPATAHGDPREPDHGERIVRYLSRYVSGMVMSNHRLISMDDGRVKFFYKDYRDGEKRKVEDLPALEFIDRFLMHILPPRFRHVRQYGFLAPQGREAKLKAIRQMLGCAEEDVQQSVLAEQPRDPLSGDSDLEGSEADAEGYPCPACGKGRMIRGKETRRPTVRQILAIPFLIWNAIARACAEQQRQQREQRQQGEPRQEQEPKAQESEEATAYQPPELPLGESRQRLLPLVFW